MKHLIRTTLVVSAALTIAIAVGSVARAADFCVSANGNPDLLVGKKFKVPGRGTCKPFFGFQMGAASIPVTGQGCTNDSNTTLTLELLSMQGGQGVTTYLITLSLPSMGGSLDTCHLGPGSYCSSLVSNSVSCPTSSVAIP